MKKTFLAGLMAFCVCAMALTTVSCGKLEDGINDLQQQVDALKQQVTDLETKLNNEVNNLEALIAAVDAKVAVVSVEKNNGAIVLTLANGNKITVAESKGYVTTVKVEDKTFWAVAKADGTVVNLNVEVGTPIEFTINPETKELLYVVDGEETATGVIVENFDTAWLTTSVEEGEETVTITIGGVSYVLPKFVEDTASIVLGRTDFFLMYGGTKTVSLTAEGIAEYYVMSKPDGWKASIDGTTLTVVAPAAKAAEVGAAELEGLVLVHATTTEGKCKVAKLNVKTGVGLDIAIDQNGNLTITNAYTSTERDEMGEPTTVFTNMYIGFATPEAFLEDPKAFVQSIVDYYDTPDMSPYVFFYNLGDNYEHQYSYVEVENEIDVITVSANEVYKSFTYQDMPYGTDYVIWVAPWDEKGQPIAEAAKYVKYSHILHEVEVVSVSHNDATVELNIEGATQYFVGMTDAWFEENGFSVKDYMKEMGPWYYIEAGYPQYMEGLVLEGGEYTGENAIKLSSLFYGQPLNFNTKYYFWVFPYQEGKEYNDYDTQMAPYVYEVTTNPLQAGGAWAATITPTTITYTSVSADITPEENTTVYYAFYSPEDYAEFADDEAVINALFEDCYSPIDYEYTATERNLEVGSSVVLATVAVGADGKYGELVEETLTTLALPTTVDENLAVVFGDWTIDYSSLKVQVTPAAGSTAYYKFYKESDIAELTEAELVAKTISMCYSPVTAASTVQSTGLSQGTTQVLVVVATNADGTAYKLDKVTKTTLSYPYDENITIEVASTTVNETGAVTMVFNVTGAEKFAMYNYYSGYSTSNFEMNVLKNGATTPAGQYKWMDVVDGKVTITFTPGYYMYDVHATAYNVTDGAVSAIAKTAVKVDISEYVED